MSVKIGLDIGGTKCAVSAGRVSEDAVEILDKVKFPTAGLSPNRVMEQFLTHIAALGEKYGEIGGVGISCGGPLDSKRGVIMSPPNLPGWDDVHIGEFFEKKLNVPVSLQNDANACAVAEWKYGAGRGVSDMIFLTFGTGLGAGIISGGRLLCGASDMAGEIGHVRLSYDKNAPSGYGKSGSCEGYCSGGGIAQLGINAIRRELDAGRVPRLWLLADKNEANVTAKLIGDEAEAGDGLSLEIYRESGTMLGRTLSILIDLLNPALIVIGGVFMRSSGLLLPSALDEIGREALSYSANAVKIVPAGLGEKIGDYAALSLA